MSNSLITTFAQININHSFYTRTRMKDLTIFPMPKTRALMRKMGLFVKITPNSFSLGYTYNKTEGYFDAETQIIPLVFAIKNVNPYFQNITEIKTYLPNEQVFLFSNLVDDQVKANGAHLQVKEKVSDLDLVEVTAEKLNKSEVEDLRIGNSIRNYFGLIYIGLTKEMLMVQAQKKSIQWNYTIDFDHRKVAWRYFFMPYADNKLKAIKIKEQGVYISPPLEEQNLVELSDGTKALKIKILPERPLLDGYSSYLKADLITNSGTTITLNLHAPTPSNIKAVEEQGSTNFYADMYVYL